MTIFDPMGLSALGTGVVIARVIFARIERRTVRISDPSASRRLPSHVDTERLSFMVFGTEWIVLVIFVLADRMPSELQRFVRIGCVAGAVALIIFHVLCVLRLRRLGIFHPHDENYRPRQAGQRRARQRPPRRAPE